MTRSSPAWFEKKKHAFHFAVLRKTPNGLLNDALSNNQNILDFTTHNRMKRKRQQEDTLAYNN